MHRRTLLSSLTSVGLVLLLNLLVSGCVGNGGPGAVDGGSDVYRQGQASDSNGTGRFYFGREIAAVTPHRGGAEWLERPTRENAELPDRLVQNMDLSAADFVADIGAGTGYLTFRIAARVPAGRVYAVDIQRAMLADIEARRDSLGVRNVETVLGTEQSPNLPPGSIDVALMVAAYHEFLYPWEMMSDVFAALKPGGKVILIEYRAEDETLEVDHLHRLSQVQARKELEAVGFVFRYSRDILPQQHFMVFEKPFAAS